MTQQDLLTELAACVLLTGVSRYIILACVIVGTSSLVILAPSSVASSPSLPADTIFTPAPDPQAEESTTVEKLVRDLAAGRSISRALAEASFNG